MRQKITLQIGFSATWRVLTRKLHKPLAASLTASIKAENPRLINPKGACGYFAHGGISYKPDQERNASVINKPIIL